MTSSDVNPYSDSAAVDVNLTGRETMDRATKLLAGIPGGLDKAVKSAINRAVAHLRSSTERAIRQKYDISAKDIRSEKNVRASYSYGQGVSATVTFNGAKIPLYRFGGSSPKAPTVNSDLWVNAMIDGMWKRVHPGLSATGHQLKGTGVTRFENAFVAQMESGHIGIFERTHGKTSAASDQIKELMGSSVPQMLGNKEVTETLAKETANKFDERLEHEITRILNGW